MEERRCILHGLVFSNASTENLNIEVSLRVGELENLNIQESLRVGELVQYVVDYVFVSRYETQLECGGK